VSVEIGVLYLATSSYRFSTIVPVTDPSAWSLGGDLHVCALTAEGAAYC